MRCRLSPTGLLGHNEPEQWRHQFPAHVPPARKAAADQAQYLEVLRRMTPAEKFAKVCELTELMRECLRAGLRQRFPELSEEELHQLYLRRLAKCHNQNY
jgi:hypothetical protein